MPRQWPKSCGAALLMDGIETKARAHALRRLIVLPVSVVCGQARRSTNGRHAIADYNAARGGAQAERCFGSHSSQATTHELLELHDDLVRRVVESFLPSLTVREHQSLQKDRPCQPNGLSDLSAGERVRQAMGESWHCHPDVRALC